MNLSCDKIIKNYCISTFLLIRISSKNIFSALMISAERQKADLNTSMEHNFYSEAASKADLNTGAQLPQSSLLLVFYVLKACIVPFCDATVQEVFLVFVCE